MTKKTFKFTARDNTNPLLTEEDFQWLDFSEAALALINDTEDHIDDESVLNMISDYKITYDSGTDFRLKAAQKALALQPQTPLNRLLMVTLQDFQRYLKI
ncbi:hypothetical protein [Commensalibacter papalotli (ex Servin-Garciduenas et al. 2014)]|uniref:Uncharacterized protein n=1 Tax=Commensalibacter papalotli (ex Servin-Garciduenas et al. 2014) TaxID=1208583 RepID=W7E189_9PROT|nr:hypothetical protein [Commensalibacter papalotli (ex Servin-Garciduenas et al. 2014)]EUK18824.1 hypothetical protein COMX_03710 [Commensalibacter papalotli (ex Servin-Garciduenas et al. 2014)]